ncbi:arylsulfatase [Pelagicoccus mobilis]|uniref:Arylsulfatase n=1 Tax=Pelagicoccus mobilis TaxID=415221 RepID=A0A934RXQ2_9BACT|nr:arylsulfatase [Pelagicoccus mobilis]MBK1875478.1 arylsulfatase [Pelagicoccus mobilis]
MKRQRFVSKICFFAFASIILLGQARESTQPNIVYILADDLGYGDLSSFGQTKFQTPEVDRLAELGMVFTQHYSGSTVCAPSRSCLMTGLHTGHTPIRGNFEIQPEGQLPMPADVQTLPQLLQESGYVTGAFGKWGLGYPGSEGDPMNHFDVFYGFNCQRLGHHYYPYHLWDNEEKVILEGNAGTASGEYAPELIHQKSLEFIEKNKDVPFFCYIPTIIPHAELAAPEEDMERFRGKFEEVKPFEGMDDGPKLRTGYYQSQAEPRTAFAAMMSVFDRHVGEVVAKLEELGIAENTLVIVTSDNGPHFEGGADPDFFDSNGVFRGKKRDLYEGGVRVPMIAYWPGKIEAGERSDLISAFWDMMPTFAEMAGAESSAKMDGLSMLPTLLGDVENQKTHEYLYWEFHDKGGRQAVRLGNWKAVKYDVLKHPNRRLKLFDLSSDPSESVNLAGSYPEVVERMEKIMKNARTHNENFTFSLRQYDAEAKK